MKAKLFETRIFFSTFCTYEIEAENEQEAILRARNQLVKRNEILKNLEYWKEADESTEIPN